MSALGQFSAALLPPEVGGPPPERVASATRRLIRRMPAHIQMGVGAGLAAVHAGTWLRHGGGLASLDPDKRAGVLRSVGRTAPGDALSEVLKSLVLLAWGAESFSGEIAEVAHAHEPSNPDGELNVIPSPEWPEVASCDVIVIGSGAGGAFAARELARAGLDTVIVEEGERWDVARIRKTDPIERFADLYRDGGATVAVGDPPVTLPIGRAVGGTTVINSGTCFRPPDHVRHRWHDEFGLALAMPERLDERLNDVWESIHIAPAPLDVIGRNAELALAGAQELGWSARPLDRNAPGCRGASQCAIGCPNNAKNGVHLNVLPQACAAGARIVSNLRVDAILTETGRATGIAARRPDGSRVEVRAPLVVAAAGTSETPPLLRRSGLGRHPRLGYGLSVHPALGVRGRFAEPVHAWRGVMQSVGVEELHETHGVMLEATASPPGMGAMVIPGVGEPLLRKLDDAPHSASIGAMIADPPSGRVVGARRPLMLYRLTRSSEAKLRVAVEAMGRVMLAAGAEQVDLGGGMPSVRDVAGLQDALARMNMRRLHLAAFHPTGTAAAGADPARHPVDPDGRLRGAQGVWVADASIVPSCPGVNPQVSIMALAGAVGENAASA